MGGPEPLSRLKEYEKAWVAFQRVHRVALGVLDNGRTENVVPYLSDDQSGTAPVPAGLDKPYPDGLLPPILPSWHGEVGYALPSSYSKWVPLILQGDERTMEGVGMQILTVAGSQYKQKDELLSPNDPFGATVAGLAKMPDIDLTKPPWWDHRAAAVDFPPGLSERQRDTLMLMRDYVETGKWIEKHIETPGGTYSLLIAEIKKDKPDKAKIDEYVRDLEYGRYMIAQTFDLAHKVVSGSRPDYSDGKLKVPVIVVPTRENRDPVTVKDDAPPPPPPGPINPQPPPAPVTEPRRERSKCSAPARRR
jgi:hypothetical protein